MTSQNDLSERVEYLEDDVKDMTNRLSDLSERVKSLEDEASMSAKIIEDANTIKALQDRIQILEKADLANTEKSIAAAKHYDNVLTRLKYAIRGGNALKTTSELLQALIGHLESEGETPRTLHPIHIKDIVKGAKERIIFLEQALALIHNEQFSLNNEKSVE